MVYLLLILIVVLIFYYATVFNAFLWDEIKTKKQLLLYLIPFYTVIEKNQGA